MPIKSFNNSYPKKPIYKSVLLSLLLEFFLFKKL